MGGRGSGNWYTRDSKTLVESCLSIDVRRLNKHCRLLPGLRFTWGWDNGCNIDIETKPDAIDLFYSVSINGQQRDEVHTIVPLSWTPCTYGGERPWFICPGEGCGKRVAKLYLNGKYFLCRHCHDLAYSSQRTAKEFRLIEKAHRIYRRFGIVDTSDTVASKSKPKGMHQDTYDTLAAKAHDLQLEGEELAYKKFI